jgi:flagellin-specific chaperone FliS
MTWWIDGIKDDEGLAKALEEEANNAVTTSLGELLEYAARRIRELNKQKELRR